MAKKVYLGNGKRKTSIAKASLKQDGKGRILVNHVPYEIIPELLFREQISELVTLIGTDKFSNVDINVNVKGGGRASQISATKIAIAFAILLATQTMGHFGNSVEEPTGVYLVGPFASIFGLLGMITILFYPVLYVARDPESSSETPKPK